MTGTKGNKVLQGADSKGKVEWGKSKRCYLNGRLKKKDKRSRQESRTVQSRTGRTEKHPPTLDRVFKRAAINTA